MKSLLIYFLVGVSFITSAQTSSKWDLGVQAGLNSSWLGFDNSYYFQNNISTQISPRVSPTIGFLSCYQFRKRIFFQAEVNYLLVKSASTTRNQLSGGSYTELSALFTIHYLEVPLFINYTFADRSKVRFSAGVGSAFRYALSSKVDAESKEVSQTIYNSYSGSIDLTDATNFVLICPVAQTSVEFNLQNKRRIQLSLRYSMSLKNSIPPPGSSELAYNYGFALSENKLKTLSLLVAYKVGF
jgi:Outer membrane protein beta-barrel domain